MNGTKKKTPHHTTQPTIHPSFCCHQFVMATKPPAKSFFPHFHRMDEMNRLPWNRTKTEVAGA